MPFALSHLFFRNERDSRILYVQKLLRNLCKKHFLLECVWYENIFNIYKSNKTYLWHSCLVIINTCFLILKMPILILYILNWHSYKYKLIIFFVCIYHKFPYTPKFYWKMISNLCFSQKIKNKSLPSVN